MVKTVASTTGVNWDQAMEYNLNYFLNVYCFRKDEIQVEQARVKKYKMR